MPEKHSKTVRFTQIQRREHNVVPIRVNDLMSQDNRTVDTASDCNTIRGEILKYLSTFI